MRFASGTVAASVVSLALALGGPAHAAPQQQSHASWVVGAAPAPPQGPGPGQLDVWKVGTIVTRDGHFGAPKTPAGNSFYVAYDNKDGDIYVPTVAGRTDVLSADSFATRGHFATLPGGRVARVSPTHDVLLVVSGKQTAGYALPDHHRLFVVNHGGNAVAFSRDGKRAYVGGNMDAAITEIEIPSGRTAHSFPIARSGDLVRADGKLFSADMKTGVVSVLYPESGKIVRLQTHEVDPHFDYKQIGKASAGFMQFGVDAAHHKVYAAGFSGHILAFASDHPRYLGEIRVRASADKANKLSGLTLVDGGREAVTTVENQKTTVIVRLSDGHIMQRLPHVASNRWVKLSS